MGTTLLEALDIGPARQTCLATVGVHTGEQLLERCGTPLGRVELHEITGLGVAQLLDWALTLDLQRLPGMTAEHARLLRRAGVDGIALLRNRNPEWVFERCLKLAPNHGWCHYFLGRVYSSVKSSDHHDIAKARKHLAKAIEGGE